MDERDDLPPKEDARALEGLLRWYAAMGVDTALDEAPHNRFETPAPPAALPRVAPARADIAPRDQAAAARTVSRLSDGARADDLVAEAERLAAEAVDLRDLEARWASVPGCTLKNASRLIPAHLPTGAGLMLVGGAPGEDDERGGTIFAGAAGRLLDAMLRAIGLDRERVGLGHVVPWRPPGNRAPTPLELSLCLPFCRRQIALAEPRVLLCLGDKAAQPLLATRDPLSRLRGRWLSFEGEATTVKTLVTFAPGFLLVQPLQKRRAWSDLLMVEAELAR